MTIKLILLALAVIMLLIALRAIWELTPRIEEEDDPPESIGGDLSVDGDVAVDDRFI